MTRELTKLEKEFLMDYSHKIEVQRFTEKHGLLNAYSVVRNAWACRSFREFDNAFKEEANIFERFNSDNERHIANQIKTQAMKQYVRIYSICSVIIIIFLVSIPFLAFIAGFLQHNLVVLAPIFWYFVYLLILTLAGDLVKIKVAGSRC